MKVNNNGISPASLPAKPPVSASAREVSAEPSAGDTELYTPSAEWLNLLHQVQQQPEIRSDRVQAVLERLQRGDYAAAASADQTAEAMLRET